MLGTTVGGGVGLNVAPARVSTLDTSVLDIEDPPADGVVGAYVKSFNPTRDEGICSAIVMSDCAVAFNGGCLLGSSSATPVSLSEAMDFKVTTEPLNADNCC